MVPHFAGLAALGTRGRGPNAVWEGLVLRNEVPFRLPRYITMKTYLRNNANATQAPPRRDLSKKNIHGGT